MTKNGNDLPLHRNFQTPDDLTHRSAPIRSGIGALRGEAIVAYALHRYTPYRINRAHLSVRLERTPRSKVLNFAVKCYEDV